MSTRIFRNGSVFDGHARRGVIGDVVVTDGVIASVGGTAAAGEIIDLDGRLLAPVSSMPTYIRCRVGSSASVAT